MAAAACDGAWVPWRRAVQERIDQPAQREREGHTDQYANANDGHPLPQDQPDHVARSPSHRHTDTYLVGPLADGICHDAVHAAQSHDER